MAAWLRERPPHLRQRHWPKPTDSLDFRESANFLGSVGQRSVLAPICAMVGVWGQHRVFTDRWFPDADCLNP
jgi:hypothetical protein